MAGITGFYGVAGAAVSFLAVAQVLLMVHSIECGIFSMGTMGGGVVYV